MALSILMVSILTSVLIFKKAMMSWLAFVFILTFSSGMMALFVYVASLTPNEKTKMKKTPTGLLLLTCGLSLPFTAPELMKTSMKVFSNQLMLMVMALVILLSLFAIVLQGHSPHQAATSNF